MGLMLVFGWLVFDLVPKRSLWLVTLRSFLPDRFPTAVQRLVRALPLTAVDDALRAVILEGKPSPPNSPASPSCWPGALSLSSSPCASSAGTERAAPADREFTSARRGRCGAANARTSSG